MSAEIFISYSSKNNFEAHLLKFALEVTLQEFSVKAWTYQRDQSPSTKLVSTSLSAQIKKSIATIFLLTPETMSSGGTQWMELAYSDAFAIETFVLLHRISFDELRRGSISPPPLITAAHCSQADDWQLLLPAIRNQLLARKA